MLHRRRMAPKKHALSLAHAAELSYGWHNDAVPAVSQLTNTIYLQTRVS